MDLVKSKWSYTLALVGLTLFHRVCTQNVYVAAPNTFRIGEKETVVIYSHSGVQEVTVSLADCPGKKKVFYSNTVIVVADKPQILDVKVDEEHIPDLNITVPSVPHYVFLMAEGKNFSKETKVLVTLQSGYVFIQTNKPIYNPSEKVKIKIIRLDESMTSDNSPFTLQIRNPQNIIVHSLPHKDLQDKNGMYITDFNFPKYPLYGVWSVFILYGLKVSLNSTVKFELRKYGTGYFEARPYINDSDTLLFPRLFLVLPTFDVYVKVPEVILPDNELVNVSLLAKYVYGKKVDGKTTLRLKVKIPTGHTEQVGSCEGVKLVKGIAHCYMETKHIKDKKNIGWFPGISGARLVVEAVVSERSSGYKGNRTTDSTVFAESPYVINFEKSLTTYIAGLDTAILAQVNNLNGNPACNVEAEVTVRDQNNNAVAVDIPKGVTNHEGLVAFVAKTKLAHSILNVTVETTSHKQPVSVHMVMFPYNSASGAYVGISRDNVLIKKVGDAYSPSIYSQPDRDMPMYYMVISKGKIVTAGSLLQKSRHQRSLNFMITADMVPSARVVLFAMHENQLLSDSLKIRVENVCNTNREVKVEVSKTYVEPGDTVTVKIMGEDNTVIGISAVDKAVYALRNKDRLTRDKMLSEMQKHDMGCGAGGGLDSATVLANAGIILMTDTLSLDQERKSCVTGKLRKRALQEIPRQFGKDITKCCDAGEKMDTDAEECLSSCQKVFSPVASIDKDMMLGVQAGNEADQSDDDVLDIDDEETLEEIQENTRVRNDFKETWLFDVDVIGSGGVLTILRTLPDSVTTWIVQVVGVSSNGGGICVAEPVEVVAFKNFFLDVKVPLSVARKEQIEIPVTIFNYGSQTRSVFVFTYANEGICSEIQLGQTSEQKKIEVKANSAGTVFFQMIPLEVKQFIIKFSAVNSGGSDTVIKTLNVIAEGVPHEEFISFAIDPSNAEKRKRTEIDSEKYEARFDNDKRKQFSIVKLQPGFDFIVPGTEYVVIQAIGDKFLPIVDTSVVNSDALLMLPRGSGETIMTYMAPTVYTLHYLKATGNMTAQQETNAFNFMKEGYNKQQTFRNPDGAFTAWPPLPSSTWLNAFVAKVFCRAGRYIYVDDNVVCGTLKWLVTKQKPDGSFEESYKLYDTEIKGGITGDVPLTSFVVTAFSQCQCKSQDLSKPIEKAVEYLKEKSVVVNDYYNMSILTYALALYDTELAKEPNEKLLQMSSYDPVLNRRYWGDGQSPLSIEASSYALLTQVLFTDHDKATSVANVLIGRSFPSTQVTVSVIEALAEYVIMSRDPHMSLAMNITSTFDPSFRIMWQFQNRNALVLRQAGLTRLGGRLVVEAEGSGVGQFSVRLGYNVANSPDSPAQCQFDVSVDVTNAEDETRNEKVVKSPPDDDFADIFNAMGFNEPQKFVGSEGRVRDVSQSSKYELNITVCSRYLKNKDANLAIIDIGILTGFKPNIQDLRDLVNDPSSLIDRFEESGRNLIFYLDKIPPDKKHCVSFRITREFVASNFESALVRVYDYYNPDEACSQFYHSESVGPELSLNCVGSICKCANGGCPKDPFERIRKVKTIAVKRIEVFKMACNEHDYFFKVLVIGNRAVKSRYIHYDMRIVEVIKEGREKRKDLEGEVRKFVAEYKCERSHLIMNQTYYMMGRDYEPRQVGVSDVYFIDLSSTLQDYLDLQSKNPKATLKQKNVQYIFNHVEGLFKSNNGCDDL